MLGAQLVQEGLIAPEALERAREHQRKTGGRLEDSLIGLRLVAERDVLAALAKRARLQFLTTEKVATLKISDDVLDRVSVRFAEAHDLVPLKIDEQKALWVLCAEPIADEVRQKLCAMSKAADAKAVLGCRTTIRAAIRRHYYRDLYAFESQGAAPSPYAAAIRPGPAPAELASIQGSVLERGVASPVPAALAPDVAGLQRELERMRVAQAFYASIAQAYELSELLLKMTSLLFELFPADAGGVVMVDEQNRHQVVELRQRDGQPAVDVQISATLLETVIREKRGLLTRDAKVDQRLSGAESIIARDLHAAMCVPILTPQKVLGAIYLETKNFGAFETKDLEMLSALAAHAALAVENVLLHRAVEQEVTTRISLSRFLSPSLVEQVANKTLTLEKGGQTCQCTILFADIRGFTEFSETRPADEVVRFLNDHFELMVDRVFEHGGVLDKFIGDALMAIWGAPVGHPDDAAHAIQCALEMMAISLERYQAGVTASRIGIGIATGPVVVGGIGSTRRLEYTAIGDTVNIASRLCGMAKPFEIRVADSTQISIQSTFHWEPLPDTLVRGKRLPVRMFKVVP